MIIYKLNTVPRYEIAPVVVHVNESDYGDSWVFEIKDGDSVFDVSGSPTVMLNICKADKNVYSDVVPGGIDETGHVTVPIEEQMTAAPGRAIAELVFMQNGKRKATANFIIDVERSPVSMGEDSDSLINYVERNREACEEATQAAQNATAAANEATSAAQAAADAAEASAEDVAETIRHIEAMPTTLQNLANTLTGAGGTNSFLVFDKDGDPAAVDCGFVTPQMYGAKGNGTTNDTTAFQNALASGRKVIIPPANYKLNSILWTDDSIVISDGGTYVNKPLIISRNLRDDAPVLRLIKEFNASVSNVRDYRVQTGCYDSTNERIILAYCYKATEDEADNAGTTDTDLVLTAYDTDWNPISGMSKVISQAGHGNSLVYNPNTHKIYSICGNSTHQVAVIDPDTLTFESWLDPVADSRTWGMAYDEKNNIYYFQFSRNGESFFRAYDASFNPLSEEFPAGIDDIIAIGKLHYGNDGLNLQGPIVIDEQYLQVMVGTKFGTDIWAANGAFLAQYDYASGDVKKVYRIESAYEADEPQCLINVEGRYYYISDSSYRDGQRNVSVSQLVMDKRLSGDSELPYTDAKMLSSSKSEKNLNNIKTIGWYVSTSEATTATLSNAPTTFGFSLYVIPFAVRDSRIQIAISSHGEVYTRCYFAATGTWYDWRQLGEGPRKGGSRSGPWNGSGFVTLGGTEIRFTIPMQTPTTTATYLPVTVNALTLTVRQDGNTLINSVDVADSSAYTVTAQMGAWGVNISVVKNSEISNAVNNDACGIQANVSLSFG